MTGPSGPAISVVVATYARPERLARLVAALEAQDLTAPFEVVIVDDGSPGPTWDELVRLTGSSALALTPVRLDDNQGPAAARNRGWREAVGPLIAFTDDDCIPAPGWLSALVEGLAGLDVVQGRTEPDPAGTWGPFSRTVEATREDFYATCNVGYRRTILERIGGFDRAYSACEDTDLALRAIAAGARAGYADRALVHHEIHPSDYRAYLREKRRWDGVALIVSRHPEIRAKLHSRWFWRASHPPALAAAVGLALAYRGQRLHSGPRLLVGLALVVPYVRFRTQVFPLPATGPRRRWLLLPAVFIADVSEVSVLARGSVRYRTLVL